MLAAGKVADACRKFEESQRLDPQGGTLLALGMCHEKEGKLATAWVEYREAGAMAKAANRPDRAAIANKAAAAIEPRLPRLSVTVSKHSLLPGLTVKRDGDELGQGAWDIAVPVDPGEHEVEASAPGRLTWRVKVAVTEAEEKKVGVPMLKEEAPAAPSASAPPPPRAGKSVPVSVWVAGGFGVAAVGVGTWFGLRAISKRGASDEHCHGSLCDPQGLELNDQAKSAAVISNVAFGLGAVGIGAAAYLYFTRDTGAPSKTGRAPVRIVAVPGPRDAAILLDGTW